ncbi:hypothetical protein [Acidovorax sp. Root217]|uniref:hypothetical protein n=1 Tax=Acidovorax sp. Root217 TaxID=1736492 RepID=UPI000709DB52|nr:hypothetical protein [Acidovorax sp. Root217]KRC30576.1 hypothetical protein ASE31_12055 [Acidovorax sp. Root217]
MSHVLERTFFNLSVVRAPLQALIGQFASLPPLVAARAERVALAFPDQPYTAAPGALPLLLWSPACSPGLTAVMPHVSSGDYFVLEYACKRFGHDGAAVRSSAASDAEPINEFVTYTGNCMQRAVRAMKDSPRWDFYQHGDPLPFESVDAYTARRVRDRLQREAVLRYLEAWGAPVRDAGFWRSAQQAITLVRGAFPVQAPAGSR